MVKTFRNDVIRALDRSLRFLTKKLAAGKITKEDLLFGLVKRHMPSKMELAFIKNQIMIDQNGEPNRYSMNATQNELRLYNRKNRHRQELHSLWTEVVGPKGKGIKRPLLQIVYGDYADNPIKQVDRRIAGDEKKKERLLDKKRRGKRVKTEADALERRIYT